MNQRTSDNDPDKRDIPSFIEPLPPLILNPYMRPKPEKGTNLMELFEEDSECEEPELLQVYLRLKPCYMSSNLYKVTSEKTLITSTDTATAGHGRRTQHNISKMYTFSKIFEAGASQKEIFENVVKDNLRKLPDGHSYTLLTYGASGSGKTYTLMGTVGSPGLVPRSLEYMFKVVDAAQRPVFKPSENGAEKLSHHNQENELQWVKKLRNMSAPLRDKYRRMSAQLQTDFSASTTDLTNRTKYYVWVSFVEIYNEGLYDLLVPCDRRCASTLRIREDSSGLTYVKGASQAFVRSGEEAYDVMVAGKHNLQVAATGVHARSSRSHCIFTITLLTQTENGEVRPSCVRLCDLAGSERAGHTRNTGARMQESRAINSSLHVLERCLHTLRRKQRLTSIANLVPYRESKLTRLLGSGLSGVRGEAVSMVVTINPDSKFVHETKHVLQLAAVAKDIQVNNTIAYPETTYLESSQDTTIQCSAEVMRLRADNERLHYELVQTQSHAKELLCAMNENQQKSAMEKTELVNEAKASVQQYYDSLMAAAEERHRFEIEELTEDYEIKLQSSSVPSGDGTPTRLQLVVAKLQKAVAVLEEKLNAERLARARAEEEVQHLRACIEERDLETSPEPNQDNEVETLSDTDDDDASEDPLNDSLEPTFSTIGTKKNASVLLQNFTQELGNIDETEVSENDDTLESKDNTSLHEKNPKDSLDISNAAKLSYSQEKVQKACSDDYNVNSCDADVSHESVHSTKNFADCKDSIDHKKVINNELEQITKATSHKRGTFVVAHVDLDESVDSGCNFSKTNRESTADTDFFIEEVDVESKRDSLVADDKVNVYRDLKEDTDFLIEEVDVGSKRDSSVVVDHKVNVAFERKEICKLIADNNVNVYRELKEDTDFLIKEIDVKSGRDSSVVEDDKVNVSFEGKQICKISKTLLSKMRSSLRNTDESDESLALFEQCEKEVASKVDFTQCRPNNKLMNINFLNEKRTYIVDNKVEKAAAIPKKVLSRENKAYFDNAHVANVDNRDTEVLLSKSKGYVIEVEKAAAIPEKEPITEKELSQENKAYFDNVYVANVDNGVLEVLLSKSKSYDIDEISDKKGQETINKNASEKIIGCVKSKSYFNEDSFGTKLSAIAKETSKCSKKEPSSRIRESENGTSSKKIPLAVDNIKILKEKRTYFDNISVNLELNQKEVSVLVNKSYNQAENVRSPSIVKDEMPYDYKLTAIQKQLGDSKTSDSNLLSSINDNLLSKVKDSLDLFDDPITLESEAVETAKADVDTIQNSMAKISLGDAPKPQKETEYYDAFEYAKKNNTTFIPETTTESNKCNNTEAEFENLYNNMTASRATEFDLLLTQEINNTDFCEDLTEISVRKEKENTNTTNIKKDGTRSVKKYNLRHKYDDPEFIPNKSTVKTKRTLRLRRQKVIDKDITAESENPSEKLKDIANLQKEFSDVTMDIPVADKIVKDIPSPEKEEEDENMAPLMDTQSCPSKSVTRSRRKLFTPRPEPLDESQDVTSDSNEPSTLRLRVPRPSYSKRRVKRKCQF